MVPELSSKKYLAVFMVLLIVLAGSLVYFDVRHKVLSLLVWLDTLGPWGPTLFILFDMLVVLFIVPGFGLIMALGAGFIFGVLTGTVYVIVGTTLGAAFAFTIARHFFGERASKFILARSKLKVFEHEFTREGWKIVLLKTWCHSFHLDFPTISMDSCIFLWGILLSQFFSESCHSRSPTFILVLWLQTSRRLASGTLRDRWWDRSCTVLVL